MMGQTLKSSGWVVLCVLLLQTVYAGVTSYKEAESDDTIFFPDDDYTRPQTRSAAHDPMNGTRNAIPMDVLRQLSCVTDYDDFLSFLDPQTLNDQDQIASRFGGGVERSNAIIAKPAACKPELTVVPLHPEGDNKGQTVLYFPSCTRVNRCGGCCQPLLSCQPTQIETLTFQVIKSEWNGAKFDYKNKELVVVEQHVKCQCDCAVRSEHCNAFQKYDKTQCTCYCTNYEERDKCNKQDDLKFWDSNSCACRCRRESECTTGSYFSENQCECIKIPSYQPKTDQNTFNRKQFIIKAIPVLPNNFTKYETTN